MSCTSHCCGSESIFDEKEAQKSYKKYKKKGPDKFTSKLLNALYQQELNTLSLLDIGGGIGVLQHELIKKGIHKTTDVDASQEYINVAKKIMNQNGSEKVMEFIYSDFNDCHKEVDQHDIVTLSRVVSCYPDAVSLINNSTAKATQYYGLIYPRDGFIAELVQKIMNVGLLLKKNPFRVFMHSEKMMDETIRSNGFEQIYYGSAFPWRIALYKRVN
ncbi:MAG: methyltransferase domain-containing protein [Flavobacteriales bacterium]|nr:methyltransferase domain-containing protein [Flavobacteriales bacterium]